MKFYNTCFFYLAATAIVVHDGVVHVADARLSSAATTDTNNNNNKSKNQKDINLKHNNARELTPGQDNNNEDDSLTVMTRNLYLGSDVSQALTATDPITFFFTLSNIWIEAIGSKFDKRMDAVAAEIEETGADLVGLQEAFDFILTDQNGPFRVSLTELVIEKLGERGLSYRVASKNPAGDNIFPIPPINGAGVPAPECNNPFTADQSVGIVGIQLGFAFCLWQTEDFDVILINEAAEQSGEIVLDPINDPNNVQGGTYVSQEIIPAPTGQASSFNRGWTYVDGIFKGEKLFRFINTHLEVNDIFNGLQANELVQSLEGPIASAPSNTAIILVGDFNSAADDFTAEEGQVPFGSTAVQNIVSAGLVDAWLATTPPGLQKFGRGDTFGQNPLLDNIDDLGYVRIDLIFTKGPVSGVHRSTEVVGNILLGESIATSTPPFWASDHFGVVTSVVFE